MKNKIHLINISFDKKSSFLRGPAEAPKRIVEELYSDAYNPYCEDLKNVLAEDVLIKHDDLRIEKYEDILPSVREALRVNEIDDMSNKPLFLGGDHSISFPLVKATREMTGPFHILHFDAHPDLYPDFEGDKYSHACPFARILENDLAMSLTQVGIRAMSPPQLPMIEKYGVKVFSMRHLDKFDPANLVGPIYISLDIDVFDPGFAPGVSHHESGGISPRQFLHWLHQINVPIVGADIVEYNPTRDIHGMTAALCAKMLKEMVGRMM